MEADGETPWQACQREVREECGLEVSRGRLACMDFRPPRPGRPGGIRYLFDCGSFGRTRLAAIVPQPEEIAGYRLADLAEALSAAAGPDPAAGARGVRGPRARVPGGRAARWRECGPR